MLWLPERTKPKTHKGEPYSYWQPKLDGWRLTACGQPDGRTLWFGREMTLGMEMSPKIAHCEWHHKIKIPEWCALDGELWVPGKPASYVSTAIAKGEQMSFTVFGAQFNKREVLPVEFNEALSFNSSWMCDRYAVSALPMLTGKPSVVKNAEGYVLIADDGTRYKYKTERTVDLIVLSVKPGKGKYKGQVGALECGVGEVLCSISGMDDTIRAALSEKDIGRVVEVKYQYVGSAGGLRHCRFIRFRDDKPASQCVWPQE